MVRHRLDPRLAGLLPGRRIYAVGDVHGHLDRLQRVHDGIRAHLRDRPCDDAAVVHLGDYIDRGPESAGVVAHLLAGPPAPGMEVFNLMGNHEAMMLAALHKASSSAVDDWLGNGGVDTLLSWGAPIRGPARDWASHLPPSHLQFIQGLLPHWSCEGALFVHAGVRPGVALVEQSLDDLLWIREPFLRWRGTMLPEASDMLVVHGHTPSQRPEIKANRLGLDTGAGHGGPLTCAVLEGAEVSFFQG